MMKDISAQAKLSKIYTNHQIRKTTATGLHRSGFSLQQIVNITKHKNLDSLKHYMEKPTLTEKHTYNQGLFQYGNKANHPGNPNPRKKNSDELLGPVMPAKKNSN